MAFVIAFIKCILTSSNIYLYKNSIGQMTISPERRYRQQVQTQVRGQVYIGVVWSWQMRTLPESISLGFVLSVKSTSSLAQNTWLYKHLMSQLPNALVMLHNRGIDQGCKSPHRSVMDIAQSRFLQLSGTSSNALHKFDICSSVVD